MNDSEIERLKRRVDELEKAQPKNLKKPYQPSVLFRLFFISQFAVMLFGGVNGNLPIIILSIFSVASSIGFIFIRENN